jgi:hypothetical protein
MDKDDKREEDQMWELSSNISRSDRRQSSSASSSSKSSEDKQTDAQKSRRMRPSVSSASSQLATVREQKEFRTLSWDKAAKKPDFIPGLTSEETVVSSKDVLKDFRKVAARDPERERKKKEKLDGYRTRNMGHHTIYNQLKKRADFEAWRMKSWFTFLRLKSSPALPRTEDLLALARHYYPPRVGRNKPCKKLELLTSALSASCESMYAISASAERSILKLLLER